MPLKDRNQATRGNVSAGTPARQEPETSIPEAAHYIASVTTELHRLARRLDMEMIAYLLDMARLEAEARSRSPDKE